MKPLGFFAIAGAAALAVAVFGGIALNAAFVGVLLKPIYIVTAAVVAALFWLPLVKTCAPRLMRTIFALFWGAALLIIADAALAQDAAIVTGHDVQNTAAIAVSAIDWTAAVKSLWDAISPAISLPLLLAYGMTWLAAFVKQATPDSSPVWKVIRYVIDMVAANVINAKNAPK